MFESLSARIGGVFSSLRSKGRISPSDIDRTCDEIRTALLEGDVSLAVVESFVSKVREKALTTIPGLQAGSNQAQALFEIVNAELVSILGGAARRVRIAKKPPTVIMLTGLQGAGKTTLAGKLARHFKEDGNTPILVASDLQRPNAVTQLQVVGESVGVPVYAPEPGNGVGDPVRVARDAIAYAHQKLHNIVIVDTAGRLGIDEALMKQARDIREAISPDEVLFVVDAMIGQDAVKTAKAFSDGVGIDGVVLTKLDGDARGGAALSITHELGKPILFASTGEKSSDFDLFYPDRMASRILGMGDVATLAEKAKQALAPHTSAMLEEKFLKGEEFTLEDFLEQLQGLSKMGSMSKLLGMLPGASSMKKELDKFDDSEITRLTSIVQSMTPHERRDPKMLNGSRRARIARGCGRNVSDVNALVDRFSMAQKAMKQMRGGKALPGVPMGAMAPIKVAPPKKKSRSGNPAKRAAEEGR